MLRTNKFSQYAKFIQTDLRLLGGLVSSALFEPYRPLMVNLVPTRRCNLSCGYCNEYDHSSAPVSLSILKARVDQLAKLNTVIITLTGGEPLLHPEIAELVAYIRVKGITPAMNTNAFLLTEEKIHALNAAGLYAMQVSVDAVLPNDVTKKALKPLMPKLKLLAKHAIFKVRINTVLGAAPAEEALDVVKTVMSLGLEAKCSLLRKSDGSVVALAPRTKKIYAQIAKLEGRSNKIFGESFQDALLRDGSIDWKCRAGARFFHVCEDGLVHLCGPRYGSPATPLERFSRDDIVRNFHEKKSCASSCPVAYAHQASQLDKFRSQKFVALTPKPKTFTA